MPSASTLVAFAAAAFVLVAIPGPNMVYLLARTLTGGRRAGLASVLGIESGTLVHTVVAAVGLSALLASSAVAFSVVRYAGAAYLVLLAVRVLRARDDDGAAPEAGAVPAQVDAVAVYRQALLTQVLNPKVAIFFLAFLPQFIDPDRAAAPQVLTLGAVLALIGSVIGIATALTAATLRRRVRVRPGGRPLGRWASGAVYLALAAYAVAGPAHRTAR
jgi:threonine/homoserine/homoserine lactone efflux protein